MNTTRLTRLFRKHAVAAAVAATFAAGAEGEIFVPGGKELAVTNLAAVTLPANSVCTMSCEMKRLCSGFVLFGSSDVNVDDTSSWSGWKRKTIVFRSPSGKDSQTPRIGTYNADTGAMCRDISIRPAKAVYAEKSGLTLGNGEMVDGNEYVFETHLGSEGRTDSRPLHHWKGVYFNTMRFCMSKGGEIVYCHALAGRRILSGRITFGALHKGGEFAAEASRDGETWTWLHTMTNSTCVSVDVPDALFPADALYIRFRGVKGGGLQLNTYNITARIDGAPVYAAGSTRYVAEDGSLIAECKGPALDADGYGEMVAEKGGLKLWRASSGWKVSRHRRIPAAKADGVEIKAAANEAESVQLVACPTDALDDLRVVCVGDLKSAAGASIPASAVEVRRVGYVRVTQATDTLGGRGDWPDPILPQDDAPFAAAAGANQPFWITVRVPKDANAGTYRGILAVTAARGGGSETVEVPFSVEVFGFALPDRATLKSAFGLNPIAMAEWHHAKTYPQRKAILDRYWRVFSEYRISPGRPAPYCFWEPKWDKSAGENAPEKWEPVFAWAEWDAEMERVRSKYHFNAFNMKPFSFWSGFGDKFRKPDLAGIKSDHPAYPKLLAKYLKGVGNHLREKGLVDDAYVYWYDEPTTATYPKVIEGMKVLAEHMPGVQRLLTEQPEAALLGNVDIWCPMPHLIHTSHEAACRAAGETFWWYLCTEPKAPFFGEFIDRAGAELRLWGWASWKCDIKGLLMWATAYWTSAAAYPDPKHPQNPYEDAMAWTSPGQAKPGQKRPWGNGDGRFVYPPARCVATAGDKDAAFIDEGPVPTVRLAMIRDGIEDYEYLSILKGLDPANALLAVPSEIHETHTRYCTDPAPMERRRFDVAREIERLLQRKR